MPSLSRAVEDYLKAIWGLQQEGQPVSTSRLAETLGLSPAAATAMVKRLARQGWVRHTPYFGVALTAAGERAALRIVRRHRVLEAFLAEVLGYPWDRVHDEAERLEHAASDELIDRLARLLGQPDRDPHGSPIPDGRGALRPEPAPTLADAPPGTRMRVLEVRARDPQALRRLGARGLFPGAVVEVLPTRAPDALRLRVDGRLRRLPRDLGAHVRLAPCEPGPQG